MFANIKMVLIDLSGTIHIENKQIPGAVVALERLREKKTRVKFVTNTTKESKRVLLDRLHHIGFQVTADEVFTSLTAARNLVASRGLSPLLLVDDKALEDFKGLPEGPTNAVVVGLAPDKFQYGCLNEAFRLILDGAPLIAIHKARYYKQLDGLALGPGPFVTGLEYAADCKAEVVGKPEAAFFLSAIEGMDVRPEECLMIGDDARDDVVGAVNAGMQGVLVRTGKYRPGDENKLPSGTQVVDSFPHAVDLLLDS
ncbi:haloacid dehalogenase-like hydrolase domain-containing protein 2 [Mya arenaria]|uniref:haloacid dehalogenase-like hydrolase domain-containing protein 2 n=1 Tax=Mya arenaria TaxID=6604 RepID=UPI0022E31227|nr:haloacid dehalogenase-like hydrolase domain-containing protein 2 [Mya arenaria]